MHVLGLGSQTCSRVLAWHSDALTVAHMQLGPVHFATHSLKVFALVLVVSGLRVASSLINLQQAMNHCLAQAKLLLHVAAPPHGDTSTHPALAFWQLLRLCEHAVCTGIACMHRTGMCASATLPALSKL